MSISSQGRPFDRVEREVDLAAWSDSAARSPSRPRREAGHRLAAAPPAAAPPLDPADDERADCSLLELTRGTSQLYLESPSLIHLAI